MGYVEGDGKYYAIVEEALKGRGGLIHLLKILTKIRLFGGLE